MKDIIKILFEMWILLSLGLFEAFVKLFIKDFRIDIEGLDE